ncbi:hypothetical protein [Salinisphaera sp. T5B8]|uniref:hypothetical protein n=1 Tax=Salinisphaera sp. T5B8 TaxID=1304154 RepID=UPI00333F734F
MTISIQSSAVVSTTAAISHPRRAVRSNVRKTTANNTRPSAANARQTNSKSAFIAIGLLADLVVSVEN